VLFSNSVLVWGHDNPVQNCGIANDIPDFGGAAIVDIKAGVEHVLVLLSTGNVLAWGCDDNGNTMVPEVARSGGAAVGIASGDWHSLVLLRSGRVFGFGRNDNNQLSIAYDDQTDAVAVYAGFGISAIAYQDGSVKVYGNSSVVDYPVLTAPLGMRVAHTAIGVYAVIGVMQPATTMSDRAGSVVGSGECMFPMACHDGLNKMQESLFWHVYRSLSLVYQTAHRQPRTTYLNHCGSNCWCCGAPGRVRAECMAVATAACAAEQWRDASAASV
jgi:hypothetical protein